MFTVKENATQEEITKELCLIYEDLQSEYPNIINQSIITVKLSSLSQDKWMALREDITDSRPKLEEFKNQFPTLILRFLQRLNEQAQANHPFINYYDLQHTGDLLQKSFFNFAHENVEKHRILVELVLEINQLIKNYFFKHRARLEQVYHWRMKLRDPSQIGKLPPNKRLSNKNHSTPSHPQTAQKLQLKEQTVQKQNTVNLIEIDSPVGTPTKIQTLFNDKSKEGTKSKGNEQPTTSNQELKKKSSSTSGALDFTKCLCLQLLRPVSQQNKVSQCKHCNLYFHNSCLKIKEQDSICYLCPYCTIRDLDPFYPVVQDICQPQFFALQHPHSAGKNFQFSLSDQQKNQQLQFRCLRVDDNHGLDEPTWPDYGEILVNGTRVMDFKALAQNTSLKKRKDAVYVLKEKLNQTIQNNWSNFVTLRELKPTPTESSQLRISTNQVYMAAIFCVQSLNPDKLIKQLKKDESSWISIETSKQMMAEKQAELGSKVEGLQIGNLKVSICCSFTTERIVTPARGTLCTHIQCFSLENLSKMTFTSAHRKWRCPLCKRKCFKLVIDTYQQQIIQKMNELKIAQNEITFRENGDLEENVFEQIGTLKSSQSQDEVYSPAQTQKQYKNEGPSEIVIEVDMEDVKHLEQLSKKIKTNKASENKTQTISQVQQPQIVQAQQQQSKPSVKPTNKNQQIILIDDD